MRKKLISILLVAAVVLGLVPLLSTADGNHQGQTTIGEYNYTLVSDPDSGIPPTSDIVAGGFGDQASNGRIWTDKSVFVNDDGDGFNVDLKVLAQEYYSTTNTTVFQPVGADVVMILDFTTSMLQENNKIEKDDGTKVTRFEALIDAFNEAVEVITTSNINNRISVYAFYGGNSTTASSYKCINIMPLGHYTSTSASTETHDKYVHVANGTNGYKCVSSTGLMKDGVAHSIDQQCGNYTCTQYAIANGINGLINDINAETDNTVLRKPYVIMMTDGGPSCVDYDWYDNPQRLTGNNATVSGNPDNADPSAFNSLVAPIILTSALWRDKLEEAYFDYNYGTESFDPDIYGVDWFNIGLGVPEGTSALDAHPASCLVNPAYLTEITANANGTNSQKIKADLVAKAANYAQKNYADGNNFVYPNEGDGFVTFANTYEVLMKAFKELAERIKLQSQNLNYPIVNHEVASGNDTTDVVFTDVIGKGMSVTTITLKQNDKAPVEAVYDSTKDIYTFAGYKTTVKITEAADGQQTLEWRLPAKEVSMFIFTDRNDVVHSPLTSADPTVLSFGLEFTDEIGEGPAYTNDFEGDPDDPSTIIPKTTVTYEIPGDNGYYFDEEHDTLWASQSGGESKSANTTGTALTHGQYTYTAGTDALGKSYAVAEGVLGNNGMVTGVLRQDMNIVVEKKWKDENGNLITDTQGLPEIKVNLYRSEEGGTKELVNEPGIVQPIKLNNGNHFQTSTYTVPIRNTATGKLYTYEIEELNCPADYFEDKSMSNTIQASDGTLTVTNIKMPDKGTVVVNKQWQNKLGEEITDTSSLDPVAIHLKRNEKTFNYRTLTIKCTDRSNKTVTLPPIMVHPGATVTYKIRIGLRSRQDVNNAQYPLKRDGTNVNCITRGQNDGVSVGGYTVWYKEPIDNHTVTIGNNNVTVSYTIQRNFNQYVTDDKLLEYVVEPIITGGTPDYDQTEYVKDMDYDYEITLDNSNRWQKVLDNLALIDPDADIPTKMHEYKYYIEEETVPGYITTYSANNTEGITGGVLTVINKELEKIGPLPETGGSGSPYRMEIIGISAVFFSMAFLFMRYYIPVSKKKRRVKNSR